MPSVFCLTDPTRIYGMISSQYNRYNPKRESTYAQHRTSCFLRIFRPERMHDEQQQQQ